MTTASTTHTMASAAASPATSAGVRIVYERRGDGHGKGQRHCCYTQRLTYTHCKLLLDLWWAVEPGMPPAFNAKRIPGFLTAVKKERPADPISSVLKRAWP